MNDWRDDEHDDECGGGWNIPCQCAVLARVRMDEQRKAKQRADALEARVDAMLRMLLESGDITPMGVRQVRAVIESPLVLP